MKKKRQGRGRPKIKKIKKTTIMSIKKISLVLQDDSTEDVNFSGEVKSITVTDDASVTTTVYPPVVDPNIPTVTVPIGKPVILAAA